MKHESGISLLFVIFFLVNTAISAQIPAFPGAQGFGAKLTTGGRGGQVIYVTTLDCDGPGSLNEALAVQGPKYILFKVSGVIDCAAGVEWGDCYIAGQTAPGGIIVRGIYIDDWYDPNGGAQNIIIRHLNSRPNTEAERPGTGWVMDDGMRLDGASRVVVDHCNFANATDESVQISRSNNVTIQYCQLAETLGDHYEFGGMLLNYSTAGHHKDSISLHHNIWNRIGGRMPEISCEQSGEAPGDMSCIQHPLRLELSNNILWDQQIETYYNSGFYTSNQEEHGLQLHANIVNNHSVVRASMCHGMYRNLMLNFSDNQLFVNGNTMSRYPTYSDYDLFYCCNDFCEAPNNPNTDQGIAQHRSTRFPFPALDYTPTENLLQLLATHAGAFNCESPGRRDPMNRRLYQALQTQTIDPHPIDGMDYYHDAYNLDFNTAPTPPTDTDADGMPDAWETAHGLNPNAQDHNGNQLSVMLTGIAGYTNLECYLNELSERLVSGSCGALGTDTPVAENWADILQNRSTGTLQVRLNTGFLTDEPLRFSLVNSAGMLAAETNSPDLLLHTNQLPSGVYVACVQLAGQMKVEKIILP